MQKFIKHTQEEKGLKITFYSPIHASNILRYGHVEGVIPANEERNQEEQVINYLTVEYDRLTEQNFSVPLKHIRRIKQTKTEEVFVVEEHIKMMQPLMETVDREDERDHILNFLESNLI